MTTIENQNPNLFQCEACQKEISTLADKCPGCGAPNNWIHPKIKHFLSVKDQIGIADGWNYKYTKTELCGSTVPTLPWWLWFVVLFCAVPGFAFGIIPGMIIAPIAYYILKLMYGKTYSFKADLKNGTWQSDNDAIWQPVRAALEI